MTITVAVALAGVAREPNAGGRLAVVATAAAGVGVRVDGGVRTAGGRRRRGHEAMVRRWGAAVTVGGGGAGVPGLGLVGGEVGTGSVYCGENNNSRETKCQAQHLQAAG